MSSEVDPLGQRDEVEIDLTRGDVVLLRVILETHMALCGKTEDVQRLHDMFAAVSLHTGFGAWD